jgi:hypothetical protein
LTCSLTVFFISKQRITYTSTKNEQSIDKVSTSE